jgi:Protein of Unknown function (DUF2784)
MTHDSWFYPVAADAVLVLHLATVVFIVGGLVLILLGGRRNWMWVRNFWFRVLHLSAIGYVVVLSWFGIDCSLTVLELSLRARAGQAVYEDDFIAHWLRALLFFEAPPCVFTSVYALVALLVVLSWTRVRPGLPPTPRRDRAAEPAQLPRQQAPAASAPPKCASRADSPPLKP